MQIKLNFGKYKGKSINEIRISYLVWCYENNMDFIKKRQPELYDYLIDNIEFIWKSYQAEMESSSAYELTYFGGD